MSVMSQYAAEREAIQAAQPPAPETAEITFDDQELEHGARKRTGATYPSLARPDKQAATPTDIITYDGEPVEVKLGPGSASTSDSLPVARVPVTSEGSPAQRLKVRLDERDFMQLVEVNLVDALAASKTHIGTCTRCKAGRVPIQVPDWPARTKALEALWDRGYGKPAQTVTVQEDTLQGLGQLRAWLELMTVEERQVLSQFVDRMTAGQP